LDVQVDFQMLTQPAFNQKTCISVCTFDVDKSSLLAESAVRLLQLKATGRRKKK